MRIRQADPAEAAHLGSIACAAKASWGYSPSQIEAWRDQLVPTSESVGSQPTFVAQIDGELAGFYQLTLDGSHAELEHLWVSPRFMRRGIGQALLAHAVRYLAHSNREWLDIDADPNAEPFYFACGAVRVGVRAAPLPEQPDRTRPQLRILIAAT
jgi:ribosomal protein S18 acetylase RimI-like enzyme